MRAQTVEQELVELETQYWQAIKDSDVDAALRLTDDPCIVTGAQGVASIAREAFAGMLKAEGWKLNAFEISNDLKVRLLRDDVAVIAYTVSEEVTVEGKPLQLRAADSSTWVRRDGRWLCALHTEAILGDPFGRDRQPMK